MRIHKPIAGFTNAFFPVNRGMSKVQNELEIITALRVNTPLPMQSPVAGLNGRLVQTLPDGTIVTMLEWVDGQDVDDIEKTDEINGSGDFMQSIFSNTMADMKWTAIKRYAEENAIVLLPIAVIEQHGPHLCLAADIYIAHIQCLSVKRILTEKGYSSIIAPPFYWGINQAARGFPGSFNIRAETMRALLFDILVSLKEFGFTRVFGVTGHNDIEHKIVAMNAFRDACEQLGNLGSAKY